MAIWPRSSRKLRAEAKAISATEIVPGFFLKIPLWWRVRGLCQQCARGVTGGFGDAITCQHPGKFLNPGVSAQGHHG